MQRISHWIRRLVLLAVVAWLAGTLTVAGSGVAVGMVSAVAAGARPVSSDGIHIVTCPDLGSVTVALSKGVATDPLPAGVQLYVSYQATDSRSGAIVTGGQQPPSTPCQKVPFAFLTPQQVSAGTLPVGVEPGDRLTGDWLVSVTVNLPGHSMPAPLSALQSLSGFSFDGPIRAYLASRQGSASVAVFDASTGASYFLNQTSYVTASIVKVDILATLLRQAQDAGRGLTAAEQATAAQMIEFSDNNAATQLWNEVGGGPGVAAFNRLVGMPNTVPGTDGFWGLTSTTSADQVQLMRVVAYPNAVLAPGSRAYIESLMRNVTPSQRWGVSGGVPSGVSVALKNGWLPYGSGWEINSIGHIAGQGRNYVIAVLTSNNPSMGYGITTIEGVSSLIWQGLLAFGLLPGSATDIATGADGSVWVTGTNPVPGGYGIYAWTGTGWAGIPGGGVHIAVGPDGSPWVVNSAHRIYHRAGSGWVLYPGSAVDMAVGANGAVWIVGTNPVPGGYGIYVWTGTGWAAIPGGAVAVAVGPTGSPWVINAVDSIFSS